MSLYEFGPFQLDAESLLLLHAGAPVALGPKVVETLLALLEHPGEVLAKNAIIDRVWPEGYVEEANLAQNIYVLRKQLKLHWDADAIETVPRRGYRFVPEVRQVERIHATPIAGRGWRRALARYRSLAASIAIAFLACATLAASSTSHAQPTNRALSATGARLYAIGHYYWNLRTASGVEKSLGYFAQVVGSDPNDPRGYAALAEANATMNDYHYGTLPQQLYLTRARAYAKQALKLDPASGEAYAALGFIALRNNHWSPALAYLRRAIDLDPSFGPSHEWYGIALMESGRLPDAFSELQTASQLDPLSVSTTAWLGSAAYLDRNYSEAIAYARQTLDLAPQWKEAYSTIGLAYEARGDYAHAIAAYQQMQIGCHECRGDAAALLAHAYARMHRLKDARAELAYATAHMSDVDPVDLTVALAAVGDRVVAATWLRKVKTNTNWMAVVNDARFDELRDDASYPQLAAKPV